MGLISVLLLLQLASFGATQCVTGWTDAGQQCMRCSSTFTGTSAEVNLATAQGVCTTNDGNLATIINRAQENEAFSCTNTGTSTTPWIGYTGIPVPSFLDGTPFMYYGFTPVAATVANCWSITSVGTWAEEANAAACGTANRPFSCSRPYENCYDLEVSEVTSVAYTHTDTSTRVDGKRWVETTATYNCSAGYSISGGTNPRTCSSDGSWTGSAPTCVLAAVCSAVTGPTDATISYSAAAVGASYTTGTVATQVCNTDYDKTSGTDSRTCQSSGAWTGSDIVCSKEDDNDNLAIGLGVGLGVPGALAVAALLYWMCHRPTALPRPAPPPPRPVGYPRRPAFRPPYPRRMGPRPLF